MFVINPVKCRVFLNDRYYLNVHLKYLNVQVRISIRHFSVIIFIGLNDGICASGDLKHLLPLH